MGRLALGVNRYKKCQQSISKNPPPNSGIVVVRRGNVKPPAAGVVRPGIHVPLPAGGIAIIGRPAGRRFTWASDRVWVASDIP